MMFLAAGVEVKLSSSPSLSAPLLIRLGFLNPRLQRHRQHNFNQHCHSTSHSFIHSKCKTMCENSSLTVLTHAVIGSCEEGDEGRNYRNPEEHVQEEQGRPGQHL